MEFTENLNSRQPTTCFRPISMITLVINRIWDEGIHFSFLCALGEDFSLECFLLLARPLYIIQAGYIYGVWLGSSWV